MGTARSPVGIPLRLLALAIATGLPSAAAEAAEEPAVIAVVACDPYADLKKQARWIGAQIDQPTLDGFLESFIMVATQFKGLAGLDVNRPAGIVVTAEGPAGVPVPRAFVPVKDLDKLLAALQGLVGPAQETNGVRTISPPGMPAIQIVEKDGWAIFAPQGSPDAAGLELEKALDPVVKSFTLGVQVFPSRMPEGMREQFKGLLQQAAGMQAQQGQSVDPEALAAGVQAIEDVESFLLGVNVDVDKERAYLENRTTMVAGSAQAAMWAEMAQATSSATAVDTADGKPAAVKMHAAMSLPEPIRQAGKARLAAIIGQLPGVVGIQAAVLDAMVDAGGIDCMLTVDRAAADFGTGKPLPAATLVMKIEDGAALEERLRELASKQDPNMPNVTVQFDAGKAGAATLHRIGIDLTGSPNAEKLGNRLDLTVAIAPKLAILLMGGDVQARAAAAADGGKPDANAKPLGGLDMSLGPLLRYAADLRNFMKAEDEATIAMLEAAAEEAATLPSALVQLLVRPIDRGVATRLSADAGAIKLLRRLGQFQQPDPQPVGLGNGLGPARRKGPLPALTP